MTGHSALRRYLYCPKRMVWRVSTGLDLLYFMSQAQMQPPPIDTARPPTVWGTHMSTIKRSPLILAQQYPPPSPCIFIHYTWKMCRLGLYAELLLPHLISLLLVVLVSLHLIACLTLVVVRCVHAVSTLWLLQHSVHTVKNTEHRIMPELAYI